MFKKIFGVLFLLLISGVALANVVPNPPAFTPPSTDVSVSFLAQIFGTVGNVLQGTSGQILGKMFDIFNKGVLVVAGLWLGYTTITVVVRSAQEGSFMGPNKNAAVVLLRIALGISLAVPSPSTGYSFLQDIVMRTVTAGVALADDTWDAALNYLNDGGVLYAPPSNSNVNKISDSAAGNILKTSAQVFTNEVCMLQSADVAKQVQQESSTSNSSNSGFFVLPSQQTQNYNVYYDRANNTIYFPGYGNTAPFDPSKEKAVCGSVTGTGGSNISDPDQQRGSAEKAASYEAMRQMVIDLMPAAKRYDCILHSGKADCEGTDPSSIHQDNATNVFNSLLGYYNLIEPYAQMKQQEADNTNRINFTAEKNAGWILAGRYYWELSQINQRYQAAGVKNAIPSVVEPSVSNSTLENYIKQATGDATNNYVPHAKDMLTTYQYTNNPGEGGGGITNIQVHVNWFVNHVLGAGKLSKIINEFQNPSQNPSNHNRNQSPIQFLMQIGQDCLHAATSIWVEGFAVILALGVAAGTCNSTSPAGVLFNNAISWAKPVLLGIAGALIVPGIILGYYLPLYPYILFTFGSIGWIILVIEAMVAAPLVAFGLTHPEGHDFLGKAEQALILLLSVFLRPVLMILGLIAGMVVSYVALRLLVIGFGGVLGSIFNVSQNAAIGTTINNVAYSSGHYHDLTAIIILPALLVIFGMLVYTITQQSFSLIHVLPDNILQWIGGPQRQDMTAQYAQRVEGAASGAAKTAGDMGGQLMAGSGEMAGRPIGGAGKKAYGAVLDSNTSKMPFGDSGGSDSKGGSPPAPSSS